MTILLHIDASARTSRSLSRDLSKIFVDTWRSHRLHDDIIRRDVGRMPPPPMTESWIGAAFTKPSERSVDQNHTLALSDMLIDELKRAAIVVLGTPMYNYGIPAALKAWVDHVIRIDKTFTFDLARGDFPLKPILEGKILVLLSACGEFGFDPGGIRENMNHLDTHLCAIKHYFGVEEMHHIAIEYQEFGGERHQASISRAHEAAKALAGQLCGNMPDERTGVLSAA